MSLNHKNISLLVILIFVGCKEPDINSAVYPSFEKLEYQITGGFAGVRYQTTIYRNGEAVFTHYYRNQKYIISVILSNEQLDSIDAVLIDNRIFDMEDEYKPSQPIMDGINYEINYNSSVRRSKNIIVEGGIEIQDGLKNILWKLSGINAFIESSANYGTLTTSWDQKETIKKWLFPEIKLGKGVFYYNEINNSTAILAYFEEIRNNTGYDILHWDLDSLYSIYDGGIDYGYFNVREAFPVKFWDDYFQVDITTVQNTGIIRSTDEWARMDILFDKTYVYVIDTLEDNGEAIKLKLIPGQPYSNQ